MLVSLELSLIAIIFYVMINLEMGFAYVSPFNDSEPAANVSGNPFSQVRPVTDKLFFPDQTDPNLNSGIFLQLETAVRMGKFRNFCEICVSMMQAKMRGEKEICGSLNPEYRITCIENLESALHADKALVYWLKNGCVHMDSTGPEVVKPCPAFSICSWIPNLFAQAPFVSKDGVEALCPRDPKFLPTIPQEYKSLLSSQ